MRKNYLLVLVKLVNHSVMKSHQETLFFRTREFEQMELEFFCKPGEEIEWQNYWKTFASEWLTDLNISEDNMRLRDHDEDELSHYSMLLLILNTNSHLVGVNYGVLRVVQTMI